MKNSISGSASIDRDIIKNGTYDYINNKKYW
jgi:hypothetical protein